MNVKVAAQNELDLHKNGMKLHKKIEIPQEKSKNSHEIRR